LDLLTINICVSKKLSIGLKKGCQCSKGHASQGTIKEGLALDTVLILWDVEANRLLDLQVV